MKKQVFILIVILSISFILIVGGGESDDCAVLRNDGPN